MAKKTDASAIDWLNDILSGKAPLPVEKQPSGNITKDAKAIMQSRPAAENEVRKMKKPKDFSGPQAEAMAKLLAIPDKEEPMRVQVQPKTEIVAEPLVENEGMIKKYNLPDIPREEFSRKNYNELLDAQATLTDKRSGEAAADLGKRSQYEGINEQAFLAALKRVNDQNAELKSNPSDFDGLAYQRSIKGQLDDLQRAPQDVDPISQLVAAFGPAILSVGFGGGAGPGAGVDAFTYGQKALDKMREQVSSERKSRIEGIGKQISGAAELRRAEAENAKQDMETQKFNINRKDKNFDFAVKYAQFLVQNKMKDSADSRNAFDKAWSEANKMQESGIKSSLGVSDKEDQQAFQAEQNQLNRDAQENRAKIAADAAAKRALTPRPIQQKPPTEGERNSANAYASLTKAEQAYQRMRKEIGNIPSMSSKFFDIQKGMFESAPGNTLMGTLIKQVPDQAMRRQIQIELDFLAPKLRKESGAAISVGEYIAEGNRHFPREGDDEATIAEKDASRAQAAENFKVGSGKAPIPAIQQPNYVPPPVLTREQKLQRLRELEGSK